jgi:hypothetical protein
MGDIVQPRGVNMIAAENTPGQVATASYFAKAAATHHRPTCRLSPASRWATAGVGGQRLEAIQQSSA